MGKPTGFLEFERKQSRETEPLKRIASYKEFHLPLSEAEQMEQGARCMDCGVPFCQFGGNVGGMTSGCPLNNLIPEWNDLVYMGKWKLALKRLLKTSPFPEFTSRVCPALCEAACTCGLNGSPVTVKENEHAIIEKGFAEGFIKPSPPSVRTGKRVAVIGSGPAGLAAAEKLNKRGHSVTVYERSDRAGGLLMYGIPNMKLDKSIVSRRLELMRAEGVEFKLSQNIGKDIDAEDIIKEYDAVVLACGASKARDITAEGRDAKGIYFAVDYLKASTQSLLDKAEPNADISAKDKSVVVIGGGDTGNDCVGTAIRQGCKSVIQLEMMPQPPKERAESNPWPEWPKILKTDYGQEEAIAKFGKEPRIWQSTVKEFKKDSGGRVKEIVVSMLKAEKDANGKTVMKPNGEELVVKADIVLIAAGFLGSEDYVTKAFKTETDQRGNVGCTGYASSRSKVFAAGDMRRGQSLVVWAIKEGIEAAGAVDEYLFGYSNI